MTAKTFSGVKTDEVKFHVVKLTRFDKLTTGVLTTGNSSKNKIPLNRHMVKNSDDICCVTLCHFIPIVNYAVGAKNMSSNQIW